MVIYFLGVINLRLCHTKSNISRYKHTIPIGNLWILWLALQVTLILKYDYEIYQISLITGQKSETGQKEETGNLHPLQSSILYNCIFWLNK